jgi:hypothetical protein
MMLWTLLVTGLWSLNATGPWLPPERLRFADEAELVAYVIDSGDGWTTLLTERDRLVVTVLTDTVKARQVCRTSADWTASTLPELLARNRLPRCE